ncbi:MAG: ATP-binding protein [Acidobacteriota bacterium]
MSRSNRPKAGGFWPAFAILLSLTAGILSVGFWYYERQAADFRQGVENGLASVADLKVEQITSWRRERIADGEAIRRNPLFTKPIVQILTHGTVRNLPDVLEALDTVRTNFGYTRVLLADTEGRVRLASGEGETQLGTVDVACVKQAVVSGRPLLTDFHDATSPRGIHLDVIVPVGDSSLSASGRAGALVLRMSPSQHFYPLIQSWPVPSRTAETLLVHREGEEVVYLNELRHRANTAFRLRFPASRRNLPASMAVRGVQGVVQGKDYRGHAVVAAVRRVPDSPWFLVAKIDADEACAGQRIRAQWAVAVVTGLLLAVGFGTNLLWFRQRTAAHLRELAMQHRELHLNAVLRAVRNVNQLITKEDDLERLIEGACRNLIETLGYSHAWIALVGKSRARLVMAQSGIDADAAAALCTMVENGNLPNCATRALATPGVVAIPDSIKECSGCPLAGSYPGCGVLASRLEFEDTTYGVLSVALPAEHVLAVEGQSLFGEMAADLAFAVRRIELAEQQRELQQALRESEQQHRLLIQHLPAGVVVHAPDTRVVLANEQACTLLGLPLDQMLGKTAIDPAWFFLREDGTPLPLDEYPVNRVLSTSEPFENVVAGVRRPSTGDCVWVLVNAFPEADAEGKIRQVVVTFIDITGRKLAEAEHERLEAQLRQSQKLESISTLAGGVAHEINNPVMSIMNYAELIGDAVPNDSEIREFAASIRQETERVATIVQNLLNFARQDKQPRAPARMCDIVEVVLSLIHTLIRHDQIIVQVTVPPDLPTIWCRKQQIQQVLMNLFTNARDALNERYPEHHENKKLTISAKAIERAGRSWLRTTVEDHGLGIPVYARERIFDPFFTTKPRDKGTGLGLSVSHGIVRDHGGEMSVESEPGTGTRFHVDLPLDDAADRMPEGQRS